MESAPWVVCEQNLIVVSYTDYLLASSVKSKGIKRFKTAFPAMFIVADHAKPARTLRVNYSAFK